MAATLKDIAAAVGISQVSVSQALRGTGRISPDMRKRVLEVARQLRYRPNGIARSMREGRTGVVGVIYTTEGAKGMLPIQQLSGAQRELVKESYEMLLCELPKTNLVEAGHASALLRQWMADGMLINHSLYLPPGIAELIHEQHVPAVWMNSKLAHNCVYHDDFAAAEEATRHLLSLGHTKIAYYDIDHALGDVDRPEHYSVADRANGYVAAMRSAGQAPRWLMAEQRVSLSQRLKWTRERLADAQTRPTAILCYAGAELPLVAAGLLGLSVPRDLSIIDFAGSLRPVLDVSLTCLLVSWEELGRASARQLLKLIGQAPLPQLPPIAVRPALVVQGSTAPPTA